MGILLLYFILNLSLCALNEINKNFKNFIIYEALGGGGGAGRYFATGTENLRYGFGSMT
jgi:hypothetical protein